MSPQQWKNVIPVASAHDEAVFDNLRDNLRLVPDLTGFVLLADDGLALCGYGEGWTEDGVQTIAAACSGLASLADGLSHPVRGGSVLHLNITMERSHLILTACGNGSTLAVYTSGPESLGLAMRETVRVARAFKPQLGVGARAGARPAE
ncbi:roadblock/LC7 domain-containing protein [Streptomyces sp. NPDC051940]|uniref:roadblock/LC7 domain-containing protein n=1 Tax=Streptomyces sp. NPDC051940 TaxID=3155675 RepID=UPI003424EAD0